MSQPHKAALRRPTTLSVLSAFAIDLLRQARWGLLAIVSGFILIPPAIAWLLWLTHGVPTASAMQPDEEPLRYYFSYVGMLFFAMTTYGILVTARVARRNGGLPVSTRLLAAWHLGSVCGLVLVANLSVQLVYWQCYGVDWPISTTSAVMTVLAAVVVSVGFWLRDSRWYRLLGGGTLIFLAGRWSVVRLQGDTLNGRPTGWYQWTPLDVVLLAAAGIVAWLFFVRAQQFYREGHPLTGRLLEHLQDPTRGAEAMATTASVDYASLPPLSALQTMDTARTRPLMIGLQAGIVLMIGGLLSLVLYGERSNIDGLLPLTLMMSSLMGFMAGTIHASSLYHTASGRPGTHVFTLPVSDALLGRFFQRQAFHLSLRVWLGVQVALVGSVLLCAALLGWDELSQKYQQSQTLRELSWRVWLIPPTCLLIIWASCGTSMSWAMLPPRFSGGLMFCGFAVVTMLFLAVVMRVPGAMLVAQVTGWIFACLVCGAGTALLVWWATRRQLLDRGLAAGLLTAAAITSVLVFVLLPAETFWKSVAAGLAILPALPAAALPTALTMCRHRRWTY